MNSENYVDEIYAFFQSCYHLKDWLRNDDSLTSAVQGAVEGYINQQRSLKLCADICNSSKHLQLNRPRSNENPAFGRKDYSLTLTANVDEAEISLKLWINTDSGAEDAFSLATECVQEWDAFLKTHSLATP